MICLDGENLLILHNFFDGQIFHERKSSRFILAALFFFAPRPVKQEKLFSETFTGKKRKSNGCANFCFPCKIHVRINKSMEKLGGTALSLHGRQRNSRMPGLMTTIKYFSAEARKVRCDIAPNRGASNRTFPTDGRIPNSLNAVNVSFRRRPRRASVLHASRRKNATHHASLDDASMRGDAGGPSLRRIESRAPRIVIVSEENRMAGARKITVVCHGQIPYYRIHDGAAHNVAPCCWTIYT